jgi:aspartate beta-hydroxylase
MTSNHARENPALGDVEEAERDAFEGMTATTMDDATLTPATRLALVKELVASKRLPRSSRPSRAPHFFYPGLPTHRIYRTEDFPWAASVIAQAEDFAGELAELEKHRDVNRAFHTVWPNYTGAGEWAMLWLRLYGEAYDENSAISPKTVAAIESVPGQCAQFGFSAIAPHTHLTAHCGVTNAKLRCHVPIDLVPGASRIRVDDEIYTWKKGELLIFDDSFEHEVWNDSDARRVVLLFDIFHPDLTEEEIAFLRVLESQSGKKTYNDLMNEYQATSSDVSWAYGPR